MVVIDILKKSSQNIRVSQRGDFWGFGWLPDTLKAKTMIGGAL